MSVVLALAAAVLFATGTWLLLQRQLSRIIVGIGLCGHGANVVLIGSGGGRGAPPLIGTGDPAGFADPLPHAFALTAIVITFGVTTLLLAIGLRSWQLTGDDEVEDDLEDRAIARRRTVDDDISDAVEHHDSVDDEPTGGGAR